MNFRNYLNEMTKSQLYMDYKTKERPEYMFQVTFSTRNKMTGMRQLETLYFKDKMSALGHADKFKKEIEAMKDLDR